MTQSFYHNIKSIKFPKSLKRIDSYAFQSGNYLTEVNLPEDLEYIGVNAFGSCPISKVTIGNKVNCDDGTPFSGTNLTEIIYSGNHIVYIPTDYKKEINIKDGVSVIPENTFNGVKSKKITIPRSVTHVKPSAFVNSVADFIILDQCQLLMQADEVLNFNSYNASSTQFILDIDSVIPAENISGNYTFNMVQILPVILIQKKQ